MGINLNKNNNFGKLTTTNLNQAKATKNAQNVTNTKLKNTTNDNNTLNSASAKPAGNTFDSNAWTCGNLRTLDDFKKEIRDKNNRYGDDGDGEAE